MKRILCIILCAVLASALLVTAKITLTPVLMKNANYGISSLKNMGQVDSLFIGSSMFRQGIATQNLDSGDNESYLLAYNGNQPFSIYLIVRELVEEGVQIKNLYVDMYAYSLTAGVGLSDERIIQDSSLDFILTVYEEMRLNGDAGAQELYQMVVKSNNETFFTWPVSFPLINTRYTKGSNVGANKGSTVEKLEALPLDFGNNRINPHQQESLEKLIALCNENGITVKFLETPKYTYLYQSDAYCSIMVEYTAFLDGYDCVQLLSRSTADACGITADEKHIVYDYDSSNPEYFTDLLHMSSDGRLRFSEILKPLLQ